MYQDLVYLAAIVLLPLLPAYILYKALPSSADVSGPLAGLTVKLGGGFGGYFVLVMVLLLYFAPKAPDVEVWTVAGKTGFAGGDQTPPSSIMISQQPRSLDLGSGGVFNMAILVKRDPRKNLEFPVLLAEHPGYATASVDLSEKPPPFAKDYKVVFDRSSRRITINEPVLLEKEPN